MKLFSFELAAIINLYDNIYMDNLDCSNITYATSVILRYPMPKLAYVICERHLISELLQVSYVSPHKRVIGKVFGSINRRWEKHSVILTDTQLYSQEVMPSHPGPSRLFNKGFSNPLVSFISETCHIKHISPQINW